MSVVVNYGRVATLTKIFMPKMTSLKILCVLMIFVKRLIWCREYEECQGITELDIIVASRKNCDKYIFCDGEDSYEGECLAGNYFNEEAGSCDYPENVKCNIKPSVNLNSIYDEDLALNESQAETIDNNDNDDSDIDLNTENEDNGESDSKESEISENTLESVTQQQGEPKCSQLYGFQNIKNIPNPESCVTFFTCYNGNAIPMLCPSKMYFNEATGKCESQMPKRCKLKYSVRLKCHKGIYDFVPHPHRCEYYFYCLNGYLMIMRCPNNFTWHYERRTCIQKSKSKCFF